MSPTAAFPSRWRAAAARRCHRWRGAGLLLALLVLLSPAAAQDGIGEVQQQWYSVLLDGRKIGQMLGERASSAAGVVSRQQLTLELERNGERLKIVSEQITRETLDGQPLGFRSVLDMGFSRTEMDAVVSDGVVELRDAGGIRRFDWPQDALLTEGQRLASQRAGEKPGTRYRFLHFDLDALQAMPVESEVVGMEDVTLDGGSERLLALRQTLHADDGRIESQLWLAPSDYQVRRMRVPMLGMHLDALACSRPCADAPNQPTDILAATSIGAPRALSSRERRAALRYRISYDGNAPSMSSLPGQWRVLDGAGIGVLVDPLGSTDRPPLPADLLANRWLESDHDELQALAIRLIGDAADPAERMRRLEAGVANHIVTKSLRIGYATALQTAQQAEGDCTEHALLLAALGRAAGIPTRVASGLAYVANFAGRRAVFVPHAWVYAWIDERWQGYDAALPGFGSGHLALDVGDGDPFGFYAGLDLLGRLRIESIERVKR
jgi:hypothetical protein